MEYEIIDLYDLIVKFSDHYVSFYKNSNSFINIFQFLLPGLKRFTENNEETVNEMSRNETKDEDLIEKYNIVKNSLKHCDERLKQIK